jgi:RND family efflux transporter MFP subunit
MILVGAVALAGAMVALAPEAVREAPPPTQTYVETVVVQQGEASIEVYATGTVEASQAISMIPQVSGSVRALHPQFMAGGRIAKGEAAVMIEPRDYELAVQQEQARVMQAQIEYDLEVERGVLASKEWEILGDVAENGRADLAQREPQRIAAEQALRAAESSLERTALQLRRATLRAPFDAIVVSESVDVGQVIGPGTTIAQLIGTQTVHIRCSVTLDEMRQVLVRDGANDGAVATVTQRIAPGVTATHIGEVIQRLGTLDPTTRTAALLIEVHEPFLGDVPLMPGAFVDVTITGRPAASAMSIPRTALREGGNVWVNNGGVLAKREVTVAWKNRHDVVIQEGLRNGDLVVTSPLAVAIEGMPVATTDGPAEANE